MTSLEYNASKISVELKQLTFREHQLEDRKKILCVFRELRKRADCEHTEEAAATEDEIEDINKDLKQISERKAELQKTYEEILVSKDQKKIDDKESQAGFDENDSSVYVVELPPSYPAPTVILDAEKLPPHPCRTQCPECRAFIITETFTSISSVTWLVCFMSAMIGCVAGCCLIPFCSDKFKSITHRCPKCRTPIVTLKTL
ncbi:uncharacterized protein litaf [Nothobranchius furzeri]|uniref:Transcript variant X1 n=1 Tax=Nothobranchius furzeri TaxID=105023 RepID=A0A1A7Z8S2_NOTFU|nr:transcript variant X1 [Nothobranchius furzeri]KAF7225666.1 transcript variant X2 [Nothobranchius furzeri]